MPQVVIIGGGWAGCAAAIAAKKAGAEEVTVLERCDMLLGTGLVGGIMRNNGRFTAAEEAIAMGGGDLFLLADSVSRHRNVDFPGHRHASLYDIARIEPAVKAKLLSLGIKIFLNTRVTDVGVNGQALTRVITAHGREYPGDVFIETTGTAGPPGNCAKFGHGCVMCIYRCPTFGPRISIAGRLGIKEKAGLNENGSVGAMSGACKLHMESLHESISAQLREKGVMVIPIPEALRKGENLLKLKACQQYADLDFAENLVLLDTGHAKLMTPFYPLDLLRKIPGLENARFEDPYSGGVGNSIRFLAISPCDVFLKTDGVENLFCAGEKSGPLVGHTEAIVTGTLAGHNAVRHFKGRVLLSLPETLACGDIIREVNQAMDTETGISQKYSFSGGVYFQRMLDSGLYSVDTLEIRKRVQRSGMEGIFSCLSA